MMFQFVYVSDLCRPRTLHTLMFNFRKHALHLKLNLLNVYCKELFNQCTGMSTKQSLYNLFNLLQALRQDMRVYSVHSSIYPFSDRPKQLFNNYTDFDKT